MAYAPRTHATDDKLWLSNIAKVDVRIRKILTDNDIQIIVNNFITSEWNPNIKNCQVAIINYDDIQDDMWFDEIANIAEKYNIEFTYITNVFYRGEQRNRIKVLFLKELYGVFYNPNIVTNAHTYSKLYTCLMQRTSFPRLQMFAELSRNKLINKGIVSLLGFQINTNLSPNEIIKDINNNFDNNFDDIVEQYRFPFRNFNEKDNCFEMEERSKYIVVLETYNDHINKKWISFTEKTFRSLQIPNISLLLNKKGSINALTEIGIKTHPINSILDYMESYDSQFNFVIGLLKNDIFNSDEACMDAKHNQNKLKEWSDILNTDAFYQDIINNLL
jgi:hypothetical protein